jgi:hypothetical protein
LRRRNRPIYFVFLLGVLVLGYASRRYAHYLPVLIQKRAGDALWASAVFVICSLICRKWSTLKLAAVALLISFGVELSQRYHAPWIDHLRSYTLGRIILGTTFFWLDLVAYVIGVAFAAAIDLVLITATSRRPRS